MKPVAVSATVSRPREEVFDHLDLLANHEAFMNHMFVEWTFFGPAAGVGARARAKVDAPFSREFAEFEVVESVRPERTVEETVSAHGKRKTRGTYRLEELPDDGTKINFELDWVEAPRSERLVPPLSRLFLRRALGKGLGRLAKELDQG